MFRTTCGTTLTLAALALGAALPVQAQDHANQAIVVWLPASSHPSMPAGLQLVCMQTSNVGAAASTTCPVVQYQGISTWAYSYADNRNSLALVSYDADNRVVRNVEKGGARYLFEAASSLPNQTVTFVGQAKRWVTVPWSDLGPAK
jgi:hypothetical protein